MTLAEMRTYIWSGLRDPAGVNAPQAAVDRLLNDGMRDVTLKTNIIIGRWTRSTVAGTELYGLPSEAVKIIGLIYDQTRLAPTLDRQINIRNNNNQGNPTRYYPVPRGFGLYTIPSSVDTLTLDAVRFPDEMTQDNTECPLPVEMHNLVVHFAIYRASMTYEPDATVSYLERYNRELARVMADIIPEQLDESQSVTEMGRAGTQEWLRGSTMAVGEPT